MSELFLDTETRLEVPSVARRCAESGYTDAVLDRAFWIEVFPEAVENLLSPNGQEAKIVLDEAALIERSATGRIQVGLRLRHGRLVSDEWAAALKLTPWMRDLAPAERDRCASVLDLLGRRFFAYPDDEVEVATPAAFAGHRGFAHELWRRYEPICRTMCRQDEPKDEQAAAVVAALGPE
jgi:hypothetical protein